jgi:hypothetical protein
MRKELPEAHHFQEKKERIVLTAFYKNKAKSGGSLAQIPTTADHHHYSTF